MIRKRCFAMVLLGGAFALPGCSAPGVAETVGELSAQQVGSPGELHGALHLSRSNATAAGEGPGADLRPPAEALPLSGGHKPVQSRRGRASSGQHHELLTGCSLRVDSAGDMITVTPVVRAGPSLNAAYSLLIREAGDSGASIRQTGAFSAEANQTIILGASVLSIEPETRLSILFSVIRDDQEICRQTVSEAELRSAE